jgi:metal-responsive CopG/Arc/MetJ family transcriptional regulator
MKTTISIDDALLRETDEAARAIGVSRSQVFALAVAEFLKRQQQERMLRQLNAVYAGDVDATEKRLLGGLKKKTGRLVKDRW